MIRPTTRLMARLHPKANGRGLNIYNPYFTAANEDALYFLFHNADPSVLLRAVRLLEIPGGVIAGSFETDPALPELMDELHPVSLATNTVGMFSWRDGKLWGAYQGGYGLRDAITSAVPDLEGKSLTIVGAGTVVTALLKVFELESLTPGPVTIYNRTPERAERLAHKFSTISQVRPLTELDHCDQGDVLINATPVGSPWVAGEKWQFSESVVARFDAVVDVTFVPLQTDLIDKANRLGKTAVHGSEMFLHQAKFVLREGMGIDMNQQVFRRLMLEDFRHNWS